VGINVLGPLTVDGPGRLGPHDRVVLQALATRLGHPVSPDELADAVWGDHPPASAAKNLQSCIVRLRKVLGAQAIATSAHGYVLAVPPDHLDANEFEAQVTRARGLLTVGESDRVAFLLEQALAQWRGPAFADLPDWAPARREADRLDELRLEAQEMHVDAMLRSGRPREVLALAQSLVRAAPLRERRWELLVLAQYQTGAQGEALRSLRQLRSVLARELGIDPSPEMLALERSILNQDPRLLVPQQRAGTAQCPWQGLRAYDVDDTERFFGRDADVAACLAILDRSSFVALVGPSGSGKSSLLRAGVLATLRRRGHRVVLLTPGPRPMQSLTALDDDAPTGTVLAVDQGEEVFSLCDDLEERRTFLERLTEESRRRPVLVTVRGDRLAQVTEHAGFSRLVEGGLHLVGALDEHGLRQAIERPAEQAGLVIEHGLVDVLVSEVRDDPGALPLLSHALLETWRRREGNTLTVQGYRASGGIHGAVAQSAEQLYGRMEPEQRRQLRDLVLRLVSPGTEGEAVRTRVPRRLVAPAHDQLVEALVAARLVTSDEGVLEITHEALTRAWPRLRGWLDDDVEGQRIRHHLSGAADAWDTLGRPASELYRGVRLTRALDWQSRAESTLTDTEREFLDAAREASDAEERSAAEHARAQARLIRRLRIVLSGAAVLLVLALAAGGIAAVQSDRASDNAAQAEQSAISALARGAAARGTTTGDLDTELLLAAAGVVLDESDETVNNLQQVLTKNPALIRSEPSIGTLTKALDVYPDGRRAALLDAAHSLSVVDLVTGRELARRQVGPARNEEDARRFVRVSPDGRLIAVGAAPLSARLLHLLDATTLEPIRVQPPDQPRRDRLVMDVQFSQDGTTLAATMGRLDRRDGFSDTSSPRAYVWSVGSRAKPHVIDLARWSTDWASAALSPDGRLLYTSTPTVRVHDLASGNVRVLSAQDPSQEEAGLEVSPDGRQLVLARGFLGTDAVLLDATTGRTRHTLSNETATFDARFSTNGRRVLTVTYIPSVVSVWDSLTGSRINRFEIPSGEPDAVDLVGVGRRVVSAPTDHGLHYWDVDGSRSYLRRVPVKEPLSARDSPGACFANPSPDGRYIHFSMCDGGGSVMDVAQRTAHPVHTPGEGYNMGDGSWSTQRAEFLNVTGGTIDVWDGRTGQVRRGPHPLDDFVSGIKHSADGSRVVVSSHSGSLLMLHGTTLQPVGTPVALMEGACCAVLGPDNRTAFVLVGDMDRTRVWKKFPSRWALVDLEAGSVLKEGSLGIDSGIWAAYSPDGRHVAAGGYDGHVSIIDTESGQLVREPQRGHTAGVFWLAFSPDGSRLVAGSNDSTVTVWDAATGDLISRIPIPEATFTASIFLPDGDIMIVPWGRNPALYVWDPSAERAVEFACLTAGRDLTGAEWAEHFPGQPFQSVCPQG
jgi:DNA-binding SARP family transcriptional activator/WD40 repeat protein/energy-coupling factor transporter ATP-binding protein EcfA2